MKPVLQFFAFATLLALVGAPAQAQEVKAGDLVITQAWSRATPGGAKIAGGFLTIENKGAAPDRLTAVSGDVAGKVEMLADASCNQTARIELPAGPSAQYTIRLSDLRIGLVRGGNVPITFTFANAGTITVPTPIGSKATLPAGCAG